MTRTVPTAPGNKRKAAMQTREERELSLLDQPGSFYFARNFLIVYEKQEN